MLVHTGPGKVRELSLPTQDSATAFTGVLFNFDIDGDTLKPQHRAWLNEHVVPQLGDPGLTIDLRGETSNTGDAAHNLDLSRRRIAQVRAFLNANGPVRAAITENAAGNADAIGRGEQAGAEDELLRAVIVKVDHSAHRLVPVIFNDFRNPTGFDPTANPRFVMLPAGSAPRVMQIENGEGLSLISTNPGVVTPQPALFSAPGPVRVSAQTTRFRLVPGILSDAEIHAVDRAGTVHARLAVSVVRQLTVRCAFHYVQNPRYGTRVRNLGDEAALIDRLNDIWEPQANIHFETLGGAAGARNLTMTEPLGDAIDSDAKFDVVTSHRNAAAQFNVFFVREVEASPTAGDFDDARTNVGPPGNCVFEDNSGLDVGLLISHESGHCLTLDHELPIHATSDMLMNHTPRTSFLPRVHVLQARRAVR